jgi:hypothetical protein
LGLAAFAIASMEVVPHDEIDGRSCLVCKASQQPLEANTAVLGPERPCVYAVCSLALDAAQSSRPSVDASSPRAPPM